MGNIRILGVFLELLYGRSISLLHGEIVFEGFVNFTTLLVEVKHVFSKNDEERYKQIDGKGYLPEIHLETNKVKVRQKVLELRSKYGGIILGRLKYIVLLSLWFNIVIPKIVSAANMPNTFV